MEDPLKGKGEFFSNIVVFHKTPKKRKGEWLSPLTVYSCLLW